MRCSVWVAVTMGTACSSAAGGSANGETEEPQEMAAEDVEETSENGQVVSDLISLEILFFSVSKRTYH